MSFKSFFIFAALVAAAAGLIGPTVFIETLGRINLFQLADRLNAVLYLYIGLGFAAILFLNTVFLWLRWYVMVSLFALVGIAGWIVSYYFFREFHTHALSQVAPSSAQ